jgi:hypothetical protein
LRKIVKRLKDGSKQLREILKPQLFSGRIKNLEEDAQACIENAKKVLGAAKNRLNH